MYNLATHSFGQTRARYKRGETTIRKVQSALLEIIFTRGFQSTNVCEIVRQAKMTRGAFYNYWQSVEECLADLLTCSNQVKQEANCNEELSPQDQDSNPSQLIQKLNEALLLPTHKGLRHLYLPLVLISEKKFVNKSLTAFLCDSIKQIRLDWQKAIQNDQKTNIIRTNVDSWITAVTLLSFVSGIIQNTNHDVEGKLNNPLKLAINNHVFSLFTSEYTPKYLQSAHIRSNSNSNEVFVLPSLLLNHKKASSTPEKT